MVSDAAEVDATQMLYKSQSKAQECLDGDAERLTRRSPWYVFVTWTSGTRFIWKCVCVWEPVLASRLSLCHNTRVTVVAAVPLCDNGGFQERGREELGAPPAKTICQLRSLG